MYLFDAGHDVFGDGHIRGSSCCRRLTVTQPVQQVNDRIAEPGGRKFGLWRRPDPARGQIASFSVSTASLISREKSAEDAYSCDKLDISLITYP